MALKPANVELSINGRSSMLSVPDPSIVTLSLSAHAVHLFSTAIEAHKAECGGKFPERIDVWISIDTGAAPERMVRRVSA